MNKILYMRVFKDLLKLLAAFQGNPPYLFVFYVKMSPSHEVLRKHWGPDLV
ncbi:hypothetical protein [Metallosphaera hakonensis]|uniref:hypothetical protein n=1 Tax=Metallosphaera hakonensis TaxID=79601 RepID=UPI000A4CA74A|nr:hypothetical protein [Metallosphaera hakonensis]